MAAVVFDSEDAVRFGHDEAIVIHAFAGWIRYNRERATNQHHGKTWTWNGYRGLAAMFPWWSAKAMRRIMNSLVDQGVLTRQLKEASRVTDVECYEYAFVDEGHFLDRRWAGTPAQTGTPPAQTGTPPAQTGTPPAQTGTQHIDTIQLPKASSPTETSTQAAPAARTSPVHRVYDRWYETRRFKETVVPAGAQTAAAKQMLTHSTEEEIAGCTDWLRTSPYYERSYTEPTLIDVKKKLPGWKSAGRPDRFLGARTNGNGQHATAESVQEKAARIRDRYLERHGMETTNG